MVQNPLFATPSLFQHPSHRFANVFFRKGDEDVGMELL